MVQTSLSLIEAIQSTDVQAVRQALADGGDINDPGQGDDPSMVFGRRPLSPLNAAIAQGNMEIIELLLHAGAAVNHGEPRPPVMTAMDHGNLDALVALHQAGAWLDEDHLGEDGGTLLHMAAKKGRRDICRWLVEQGLELEARNQSQQTPLSVCLKDGFGTPHKTTALELLSLGANPNCNSPYADGRTLNNPLGQAALFGDGELVRHLIAAGGRVEEALAPKPGYKKATSAIVSALCREDGAPGVVSALIEAGDDLTIKGHIYFKGGGYHENDLLPLAVRQGDDVIDLLALAAAETKVEEAQALIAAGMEVNAESKCGRNALLVMLERANETVSPQQRKTVQLLLDAGSDPDVRGPGGNTALHLLANRYNRMPHSETSTMKMLTAVLDAGADPWITNDDGMTALESMLTAATETSPGPLLLRSTMERNQMQQQTPHSQGRKRERRL